MRTQTRSHQAACRRCLATQQPGHEWPLCLGLSDLSGRQVGLTGWTPYPPSSARADAPCGPLAALGQRATSCARPVAFRTATSTTLKGGGWRLSVPLCPTAVGAVVLSHPRASVTRLGPLSAEGLVPRRLPLNASAAVGGHRLLRARALRSPNGCSPRLGRCALPHHAIACCWSLACLRPPGTARLLARAKPWTLPPCASLAVRYGRLSAATQAWQRSGRSRPT